MDLLGFDIMLDDKLKPWMIEVNHMPSFRADTDIDYEIKHDLIKNTLKILQLSIEQRKQIEQILRQEKNAVPACRRMTVLEHSDRVRFKTSLIHKYIPNSNFKQIYPIQEKSQRKNNDFYDKLEKSAVVQWDKQLYVK